MRHNVSHVSLLIIRLSVLVAYALINISNNEQNIKVEKFMNQQLTQNIANIQSIQQVLDLKPKIPDYQRPYKWQKHHVSQLFNELPLLRGANIEIFFLLIQIFLSLFFTFFLTH